MRTTVDLPEPLHRIARSLAQHTGRTFSQTVAELMQRGLSAPEAGSRNSNRAGAAVFSRHPLTGLPLLRSRRIVTPEDVAALEDEV